MVMKSATTRDTLGRVFKTQESDHLHNAHLSGDRESVRSGLARRMDERKGAELLNGRNFGKNRAVAQAPLDARRMSHGDGLRAAEKILPFKELNPKAQSDMISLFKNPAVVRAFVTNPDKTIHAISETMPHLKEVLERNAPFTKNGSAFEINTRSKMYEIIQGDRGSRGHSTASELRNDLDGLLVGVVGPRLGGARGMETASYNLLSAYARHGAASAHTFRAARTLSALAESDRASADLSIVRAIAGRTHEGTRAVSGWSQPTVSLPVYTPPLPSPNSVPSVVTTPPTISAPSLANASAPIVETHQPRGVPPLPQAAPPPQLKVIEPRSDLPRLEVPQGLRVITPPMGPSITPPETAPSVSTVAPKVEPPAVSQTSPVSAVVSSQTVVFTPTMVLLLEAVNKSSLQRQIGGPRDKPVLEFSDEDQNRLKKMLTDPVMKAELLKYSDAQMKACFEGVRPDRIEYLEQWLATNHRGAVNSPLLAESIAGITPADTNRIGQVVQIAREVAKERRSPTRETTDQPPAPLR